MVGVIPDHAEHLVLNHPISGKELDLRAPMPKDFQLMIKTLKQAVAASVPPKPKVRPRDLDRVADRGWRR